MRVGIREWAETIVIFLAGGIPQGEFDVLAIDLNIGHIVLKDSWDIDLKYGAMSGTESQSLLKWKCAELYMRRDGFGEADQRNQIRATGGGRRHGLPLGRYPWRKHWR